MRVLLLSAALALASGALEPQEPADRAPQAEERADVPGAPPKAPVAGMAGFRSKSRVVRSCDPDQALLLEAFYVFPARVRLSLIPEGAPAKQRRLDFRFGEDYWTIAPGQAASQPLTPTADVSRLRGYDHSYRGWTEVHMELRRAAMLWPDGLAWEGEGALRIAHSPVEGRLMLHFGPEPVPLVLLARLDGDGRPEEIRAQATPHGGVETFETGMALVDITWRQRGERWWPRSFTLVGLGGPEWHETVESIDTAINALDTFFVPPDRRDQAGSGSGRTAGLVLLPAALQRRVALPEAISWAEARDRASRLASEESARLEPLGGALKPGLVLELDSRGVPRAVLLRLAAEPSPLPEGWEQIPAREGASLRGPGGGPVSAGALRRLQALVPPQARPGTPYALIVDEPTGGDALQVVLPFVRAG